MSTDTALLAFLALVVGGAWFKDLNSSLSIEDSFLLGLAFAAAAIVGLALLWEWKSLPARKRRRQIVRVGEIPGELKIASDQAVLMGMELELGLPIYLPDSVRLRHTHIIGATGSGKTESVILNFLRQDVMRGLGAIILDAKGDESFLSFLGESVPSERLRVFDLGVDDGCSYNPLAVGSPMEAAQRLFSSLTWSETYYQSKALSALQRIFERHHSIFGENPRLRDVSTVLESPSSFSDAVSSTDAYPIKLAQDDFSELSGLRDQINILCSGHLARILSPTGAGDVLLEEAVNGQVLYFRLQSLLSPQLVTTTGKLLINNLNYLAGTAHRANRTSGRNMVPTYLDEFASFACPEFADLISKARSAGIALHFSHQSIGDLADVQEGFLSRITDNSATKIVMRINDPDTADMFARSFGTVQAKRITQQVTNSHELELAEVVGTGSLRETREFRASPDLLKTLPTGVGAVLVAHGHDTPHGASTVFRIKFPRLKGKL